MVEVKQKNGSLKLCCCPTDWEMALTLSDGGKAIISMGTEGREAVVLHLSDLPVDRNGRIDFEGVDSLYVCGGVIRAMEVQRVMDGYLQAGKMTPFQRRFFLPMALSDLGAYQRAMDAAPHMVDFTVRGTGQEGNSSDLSEVQQIESHLDSKAKDAMQLNDKLDYSAALKIACRD